MKSCSLKSRERHKIQSNKHVTKAFKLEDKYKYIAKVISQITWLSPVLSSEDTQITLTAAMASPQLAPRETAKIQANYYHCATTTTATIYGECESYPLKSKPASP